MRARTRGPYRPVGSAEDKNSPSPSREPPIKTIAQCVFNIYTPRAARFISDIGISVIPEYAFMSISATATARIFRVLIARERAYEPSRYHDESYFIIFRRREPESTRSLVRPLKAEFITRRTIRLESQDRRRGKEKKKEKSLLRLNEQQQRLFLVFHFLILPTPVPFHALVPRTIARKNRVLATMENVKGTFHATPLSCNKPRS